MPTNVNDQHEPTNLDATDLDNVLGGAGCCAPGAACCTPGAACCPPTGTAATPQPASRFRFPFRLR